MYVAIRKALGDKTRERQDVETWDGYEGAVLNWMTHKNRFAAQASRYFGEETHGRLQNIQDIFHKAGSLTAATYYATKDSVVKDGKGDTGEFDAILEPLEDKLLEFSEQMIREIQNHNVGRLRSMS